MQALIDKRFNIVCQIELDTNTFAVAEDFEWVPCPDSCDTTWTYDGTTFTAPVDTTPSALTDAQLRAIIIEDRNKRLADCDWTQLPDIPSTVDKAAWAVYRQALRDLPNNNLDVHNPVYPVPPIV